MTVTRFAVDLGVLPVALDLGGIEIVDAPHSRAAAEKAVVVEKPADKPVRAKAKARRQNGKKRLTTPKIQLSAVMLSRTIRLQLAVI